MTPDPDGPAPDLLSVEIDSDGHGYGTEVRVNGVPVTCITSLHYEITAQGWGRLTLVCEGGPLRLTGSAEVVVTEAEAERGPA